MYNTNDGLEHAPMALSLNTEIINKDEKTNKPLTFDELANEIIILMARSRRSNMCSNCFMHVVNAIATAMALQSQISQGSHVSTEKH